jgi:hypothetical protein
MVDRQAGEWRCRTEARTAVLTLVYRPRDGIEMSAGSPESADTGRSVRAL